MILGIVGIIVALLVFLILIYKGVSLYISAPICVIIIAVTNNLNPLTSFTGTYVNGFTSLIGTMFSIIFFGVILGKVYADTGSAQAIATGLMKRFVLNKPATTEKDKEKRIKLALLVVFIFGGLCTMGGIDGYVLMFTAIPIILIIQEQVDIPRRFAAGMLFLNCCFMAAPGAPQISNVIGVAVLNGAGFKVTSTGGLVVGIIGVLIIGIGGYFALVNMILKARRNGEKFDYGNLKPFELNSDRKLPNFYLSFVPLILVFVLYTIFHLSITISLLSGIVVNLIVAGRYIEKGNRSRAVAIRDTLNSGSFGYPNALLNIITPAGLAAVITATAAFGKVTGGIAGLNVSIYLIVFIAVAVVVALTASPPAALIVSIPMVIGIVAARGLNIDMGNVLRIAVLTSITFESLPWNGMIVTCNQMIDSDHKRSYGIVFIQTVAYTTLAALVAVVLNIIFPNMP